MATITNLPESSGRPLPSISIYQYWGWWRQKDSSVGDEVLQGQRY